MKKLIVIFSLFILHSSLSFAQGLWTQRTSFPSTARSNAIGFSIGNMGYMGLGSGSGIRDNFYQDFWQYNPSNNTWIQKAKYPGLNYYSPATFVIGHKAYIVTGADSTYALNNECWEYDGDANTWTQKNNFTGPERACAVGFAIGNKGFIGTGCTTDTIYKDIWEYDTASDTWTQKADFGGTARYYACGFSVGNKGYICFGCIVYESEFVRDIWEYDTTLDLWTQKTSYPSGVTLQCVNGFVIDSNIFLGTGQDSSANCYQWFWKYNTVNDSWTEQANFLGAPRNCCNSFAIGDTGYFGLGVDNNATFYNDFYKFYPDTLTGINEVSAEESISIYPNPCNGIFTIALRQPELVSGSQVSIEIYNALGKEVFTAILNDVQYNKINMGNQPSGIYILKISVTNQLFYSKLIINN